MLFFIGVWLYFMRKNPFWKQGDYYERRQRHMEKAEELLGSVPHVRGDEPLTRIPPPHDGWCSPRAWG
jgi:hypothetical protein